MMSDYVYMKITRDEYELPLAIANSAAELARILGLKPKTVINSMSRARTGRRHSTQYIRVNVSEEGNNGTAYD